VARAGLSRATILRVALSSALALPACAVAQEFRLRVPLGLDERALLIPADNPLTQEKIDLGKQLFFDRRWSKTKSVSCASCHQPQRGWSDDRRLSVDHEGKPTRRHAPTIINRAFSTLEGWAGHRSSTEDLLLQLPFTSAESIEGNLGLVAGYKAQFQRVFGTPVTAQAVAKAIAAFQRTLLSGNSAYDRYRAGDAAALSAAARRGLALFEGKAACVKCHNGFNFSDQGFHNTGIGTALDNPDLGRYEVTKRNVNKAAFKTPTLRDVARRGPYMHDGSIATLREVVAFYDRGGIANPSLSPDLARLGLSASEQDDLIAFLESLSGEITPQASQLPLLPP
jgi:cytochrome c peroxidase